MWCVRSKTKYFLLISNEKTIKSTSREINNFNWNWKCSYNTQHKLHMHICYAIAIDSETMLKNSLIFFFFIPFDHEIHKYSNGRQSIPSRLSSPPFFFFFHFFPLYLFFCVVLLLSPQGDHRFFACARCSLLLFFSVHFYSETSISIISFNNFYLH